MILQLQAKVHGLGNLGVSTYTYLSLSEFKATFCFIHSSRRENFTRDLPGKLGKKILQEIYMEKN